MRDQSIRSAGEEFTKIKLQINNNKDILHERKDLLKGEIAENKRL